MNSIKIVFILSLIWTTILGKTILRNDDLNLEGSGKTTPTPSKGSELEMEENIIDMGQTDKQTTIAINSDKPSESVTVGSDASVANVPMCSMDPDKFNMKISELMEKFVPDQLNLKPIVRGALAKVYLQNGKLMINRDYQLTGQPLCNEVDEKTKQYEIMVSFNNLMGSFDWKILNLFGYNFSESALLTVKSMVTELVIVENSHQRTKLKDLKVGKIDDIDVNVNIPDRITTISFLKPMVEYIISRITTTIANGSMDSIVKNMRESFIDSIQEKTKINP